MFYYALKAVVYPMGPVFDLQANEGVGALTPFCIKALKRIFLMSDKDKVSTSSGSLSVFLIVGQTLLPAPIEKKLIVNPDRTGILYTVR